MAEHYQSIACGNKAVKLNELKRFALNFKLSTPIPADLVPVLAKDEIKQGAIVQKALKQATAGEHSGFVHELDKKLQEDCKRAFDQPLQERLRAAYVKVISYDLHVLTGAGDTRRNSLARPRMCTLGL